jgi:hypothetical protein
VLFRSSNEALFGAISVVFFADLLQLPPVKGNQPFVPVTFFEAKQRIGAIAPIELWNAFEYDELTINMRQSGDSQYASLLANLRVGQLNDEQHELLQTRLITSGKRATVKEICNKYQELTEDGKSPIIILPRTLLCEEINTAMLQTLPSDIQHYVPSRIKCDHVG